MPCFILVVIHRLFLESVHAADELVHTVRIMGDPIIFADVANVAVHFVGHSARSMLFLDMAFCRPVGCASLA